MNDEIKRLAEQAGLDHEVFSDNQLRLNDFAELIRQDEREACAQVCDEASLYFEYDRASPEYSADYCAKEIRARGKK